MGMKCDIAEFAHTVELQLTDLEKYVYSNSGDEYLDYSHYVTPEADGTGKEIPAIGWTLTIELQNPLNSYGGLNVYELDGWMCDGYDARLERLAQFKEQDREKAYWSFKAVVLRIQEVIPNFPGDKLLNGARATVVLGEF